MESQSRRLAIPHRTDVRDPPCLQPVRSGLLARRRADHAFAAHGRDRPAGPPGSEPDGKGFHRAGTGRSDRSGFKQIFNLKRRSQRRDSGVEEVEEQEQNMRRMAYWLLPVLFCPAAFGAQQSKKTEEDLCVAPPSSARPPLPARLLPGQGKVHLEITTSSLKAQEFFD